MSSENAREKLSVAILLSMGAGYMDGFTFFHLNGRFAGAQTGNVIQAGIALAQLNFSHFWDFFVPIVFFAAGVMFDVFFVHKLTEKNRPVEKRLMLFLLICLTAFTAFYEMVSAFVPGTYFVGILSFIMAVQYGVFNRTRGLAYTSIFTTGNLRNLSENLARYIITKERKYLENAAVFSFIVPSFLVGAFFATLTGKFLGNWALLVNSLDLLVVYIIL